MACALLVVLDANLPKSGTLGRAETPGLMLMAALPHRRLEHETKRHTPGVEAVYVDTARAEIAGFTLIELAIVLVVIGFLVGGVLVGRDMIGAAAGRAQITQIEKLNAAVNAFRGKYDGIPGDLSATLAAQFGFSTAQNCNGSQAGARDGNGLIDGYLLPYQLVQATGETGLFWQDLSTARLIDGAPTVGVLIGCQGYNPTVISTAVPQYFYPAKIGNGSYVYVYETNGQNWFGVSAVTGVFAGADMASSPSITVQQAYAIDKKLDDGFPTTGLVQAIYVNNSGGGPTSTSTAPNAVSDNTTTCYNTATTPAAYSIQLNGGSGVNCALSFRMQAGD